MKQRPTALQLEKELKRADYAGRFRSALKSTVFLLLTTAAVSVLAATLWFPVLQIYGDSMAPTLSSGNVVLCIKTSDADPGDVIAFYDNNKLLVKRCIAGPGSRVDIREDGTVLVNGQEQSEPYVMEKDFGDADAELPCQVPEGMRFVLGDNREISVDSRHSVLGCVHQERILGKVVFRLWPLDAIGSIK